MEYLYKMKYSLVIDSMAAVPESFLRKKHVKVIPIHVQAGGNTFADPISERVRIKHYEDGLINVKNGIGSVPPTEQEIFDLVMDRVVPEYDFAICQSIAESASPIYGNFSSVANRISKEARSLRDEVGIDAPFRLSSLSTGSSVAGQGLIAIYADLSLSKGLDFVAYTKQVEKFKGATQGFTIVKDTFHARQRAIDKGVDTVGLPTALIGRAIGMAATTLFKNEVNQHIEIKPGFKKAVERLLRYARQQIKSGLYLPVVNVSYAGDLDDIKQIDEFSKLLRDAKVSKTAVFLSVMPLSAAVNYGPGAFSLGIAPRDQEVILE